MRSAIARRPGDYRADGPGARAICAPIRSETLPVAPKLATFSEKYKSTHLACDLPSHVDQGIIGLMDPAHGPFVHQSDLRLCQWRRSWRRSAKNIRARTWHAICHRT